MTKIILFGTGNLGKRYIQAISKISEIELYLFDISLNSLQSVGNFLKTSKIEFLNYMTCTDFNETVDLIDKETIVIVATTTPGREGILESIIPKKPRAILCEKPVVQRDEDYLKIVNDLEVNKVRTYVDFTLRMQPFYQKIKSKISRSTSGILYVNLPKTGLACVGIHQIDLFMWLFNLKSCSLVNSSFSNFYEQKRAGFYDIVGSLELTSGDFKAFINNSPDENIRTAQLIVNDMVISVFEDQRVMSFVMKSDTGNIRTEILEYSFVSSYMTDIINKVIKNNFEDISLPGIEESYIQHKILYEYMQRHSIQDLNFT